MDDNKKNEIIDLIIKNINKTHKNYNYRNFLNYLIINYYYAKDRNDKSMYIKIKKEFINLLDHLDHRKVPLGNTYGYTMLLYLMDCFDIKSYKEEIINKIIFYCLDVVEKDERNSINMIPGIYDLLNGLSGILLYFINLENTDKYNDFIKKSILWITKKINEDSINFKSFMIKKEYIIDPKIRNACKEGYIDLGLSHGLIAIAIMLSAAYKKNYLKKQCLNNIEKIINLYLSLERRYETGMYPEVVEVIQNMKIPHYKHRVSWCYGSIGILRALYIISVNTDNIQLKKHVIENLKNLYFIGIHRYMLKCPTFCHGYSGIYLISYLFENDLHDDRFIFELKRKEAEKIIWSMGKEQNNFYFYTNDVEKEEKNEKELNDLNFLDGITSILVSYLSTKINEDLFIKILSLK